MTQYNTLNVNLSNSQLNKLKLESTEATLNLSSNVASDSSATTNFLHELLLTDTQILRLRKGFSSNSSPNIKL